MTTRLHTFPSSDPEFGSFAQETWAGLPEPRNPAELQQALRARYPASVVTAQDELARHGSAQPVWYAFRSATLTWQRPESAEDWPAWAILDDDRRFVEVNDELAAIVELPAAAMVGHHVEEFSNPADPTIREDIERLWEDFVVRRSVASTMRFNRADGTLRELAWWLEANDAGPGRHRLSVRELSS